MGKPWFPFYVGDFVRDTLDMSAEEIGAYILLICHYWTNGGLPMDEQRLARIARLEECQWTCVRNALAVRFDRNWRHRRIDEELQKAEIKSVKATLSANKRWKDKQESANAMAKRRHAKRICLGNANHNQNIKQVEPLAGTLGAAVASLGEAVAKKGPAR